MLNKEKYSDLENMLTKSDKPGKKDVLNSFQEELIYELTELYINNKKNELDKELRSFKRFKKLLKNHVEEVVSYQIGIIVGIILIIELLVHKSSVKNEFTIKMSALFSKDINQKILVYLYDHPSSQHKVIAQALGIQSNYLSQQMRELEEAGGVVRYGVDRRSFYELTLDGQAYVEKNKLKKEHTLYIDELMKEIGLNTKCKSPNYQAFKTRRNWLILHKTEGEIVNAK